MGLASLARGFIAATLLAVGADAATFSVTTTDDTGPGSLRDVIEQANAAAGADRIVFDIAGAGPHVIEPVSALPVIAEAVDLDGTSQDGIVLDGGLTPNPDRTGPTLNTDGFPAFVIQSDGSTIAGLEIRGFLRGVAIGNRGVSGEISASGNTIRGNRIHGNEIQAVDILAEGPLVSASDNTVENNVLHNNFGGVQLQAFDGGTCSGNKIDKNQIHDNVATGLQLVTVVVSPNGATASDNMIRGNDIFSNGNAGGDGGLGLVAIGIGATGITATVAGNTVENNHIHNNAPHGLWLVAGINDGGSALTTKNQIVGNTIEANDGWGVKILGTPGGFPPIFADDTVVDNVFQSNTFTGNGLGEINWPAGTNPTPVQGTTWGAVKAQGQR